MSKRESVIEVSAQISKLRAEAARIKGELSKRETELDALLGSQDTAYHTPHSDIEAVNVLAETIRQAREGSINFRIVELLDLTPDSSYNAERLQKIMGANIASIRSALPRLADQGKIRRAGRGQYQSVKQTEEQESTAA